MELPHIKVTGTRGGKGIVGWGGGGGWGVGAGWWWSRNNADVSIKEPEPEEVVDRSIDSAPVSSNYKQLSSLDRLA